MTKFNFLQRLLFLLNIIAGFALLLAYVSPYVKPTSFWPIAFFGLALPYLYLLNVIFLLIWVLIGNIRFLMTLIILILGYKAVPRYIQMRFNPPVESKKGIKVMSFNVRVFDLYMWSKEKTVRNQIFDFLNDEQADILCLQEFYDKEDDNPKYEFKTLDTLISFIKAKNYHFHATNQPLYKKSSVKQKFGIITFSKYPIVDKGLVSFKETDGNACIYTDIKVGTKIYRVYNAHLASIKLNKYDYKSIEKINNNDYSENFGNEKMLINKLKAGFLRREHQADSMAKSISESPYPVIVCGDFNDTPASYAYEEIKGELNDAFIESGSGTGATYIGQFPSFRIDYIFYNDALRSESYTTHPVKLSDHHPISVNLYPQ